LNGNAAPGQKRNPKGEPYLSLSFPDRHMGGEKGKKKKNEMWSPSSELVQKAPFFRLVTDQKKKGKRRTGERSPNPGQSGWRVDKKSEKKSLSKSTRRGPIEGGKERVSGGAPKPRQKKKKILQSLALSHPKSYSVKRRKKERRKKGGRGGKRSRPQKTRLRYNWRPREGEKKKGIQGRGEDKTGCDPHPLFHFGVFGAFQRGRKGEFEREKRKEEQGGIRLVPQRK